MNVSRPLPGFGAVAHSRGAARALVHSPRAIALPRRSPRRRANRDATASPSPSAAVCTNVSRRRAATRSSTCRGLAVEAVRARLSAPFAARTARLFLRPDFLESTAKRRRDETISAARCSAMSCLPKRNFLPTRARRTEAARRRRCPKSRPTPKNIGNASQGFGRPCNCMSGTSKRSRKSSATCTEHRVRHSAQILLRNRRCAGAPEWLLRMWVSH